MIFKKFKIFLEFAFYISQQVDGRLNIDLDAKELLWLLPLWLTWLLKMATVTLALNCNLQSSSQIERENVKRALISYYVFYLQKSFI